jgi:excisionase family DNA binding protein
MGFGGVKAAESLSVSWLTPEVSGCAGQLKGVQRVCRVVQGFIRFVSGVSEDSLMAALAQVATREVMDIRQASEYLGISGDTLYRYASEGFIPAFKLGNRWRFKKSLLDAWMDEKSGVKPPATVTVMPKQKKPAGRAR